ncbi:MAG TPA: hypothetical protein VFG83_01220 [Kofleriaceae bacterium]|nr:hypothetical protein [Kofleriaceae bacterium]
MPDLQREINQRIETFVNEVAALARRAAIESLSEALDHPTSGRRRGRPPKNGASLADAVVTNGRRGRRRGSKGGKRSQAEITRAVERLHGYIQEHPGERMEQIAKGLGSTTKDLRLPVNKLVGDDLIRTEGEKRATRYFSAAGGKSRGRRKKA